MDQNVFTILIQEFDHQAQTDDFGACPQDRHDLQASISPARASTSSSISRRSFNMRTVSSMLMRSSAELYSLVRQPEPTRGPHTSGSMGRMTYHLPRTRVRCASSSLTKLSCTFSPGRMPVISILTLRFPISAAATFVISADGALGM